MPRPSWHVQHITTSAGQLFVKSREGVGMTLILWPSVFYDHSMYQGMIEWLDNPVVLVDGPGHGSSQSCPALVTLESCGYAMEEILQDLGISEAVCIGTSWGGLVSLKYALLDRKSRVKGLVLSNVPFDMPSRPSLSTRLIVAMSRFMPGARMFRESVARSFFSPETPLRHPEVIRNFLQQPSTFRHPDLYPVIRSVLVSRESMVPDLGSLTLPTLVLAGEDDKLYPPAIMQAQAKAIRGHRFEIIPAAGHIAPAERPRETAMRIKDWLATTFPVISPQEA